MSSTTRPSAAAAADARPGLALLLAILAVPGVTAAWELPLGGLWIGLPLAVAAIVLGVRARAQDARPVMATVAIVLAVICIAFVTLGSGCRSELSVRAATVRQADVRAQPPNPRPPTDQRLACRSLEVVREQLFDGHGRAIRDVRVSVTDRCNFRCQYCMPADGLPWLERDAVLTFEEIERVVRLLSEMGVHAVRLTGGEPLVRRDFPQLAGMLAALPHVEDLSLTTNGFLLERDAQALVEAGIQRFNVSIDSLQRDRFFEMTRRDALPRVLRGLEALAAFPQAHPIKVNAVAIRGFTEQEVLPFARFAREHPYEVRFIEFMPLDADHAWTPDQVLTGAEIRAAIDAVYPIVPEPREPSATARVYRFADGKGRIGFIDPVSEPFCGDCDRIRITAEGHLRTCLFSLGETDLREPLRSGAGDAEIEQTIRDAVWRKELKHHVNEPGFIQPARSMSAIGG